MAVYVPKYKGYIADVADIDFKRCDGKIYSCREATATSITPSGDALTINGGQGLFPLAYIDSARGLDCSFTNAAFDMDMFEITNATDAVDGDSCTLETKKWAVITGNKIELPFQVDTTTVYVRGLALGSTVASGTFTAAYADGKTTLTFNATDAPVGDEIYVSYNRRIASSHVVSVKTTTPTARGEAWYHFPVYSSGTDCTEAAIKGWVHVHVYRVRVTTPVNIDTSYKTAATFPVTFGSLDPQRADGRMYDIDYEELNSNGEYNTTYSQGTFVYH